jgi:hypothetical protein
MAEKIDIPAPKRKTDKRRIGKLSCGRGFSKALPQMKKYQNFNETRNRDIESVSQQL